MSSLADLDRVIEAMDTLCSDLESELRHRYGEDPHPAMADRMDRDMEPVEEGREALTLLRQMREGAVEGVAFRDGDKFCPEQRCDTHGASSVFVPFCMHDNGADDDERPALLITLEDG